jgi:uncharacterized ion transporter superfamily protein YfcC
MSGIESQVSDGLLQSVNNRVDEAIRKNRGKERTIILMAVAIFVLGCAVIGVGYKQENPYITAGALVLEGCLYWR